MAVGHGPPLMALRQVTYFQFCGYDVILGVDL